MRTSLSQQIQSALIYTDNASSKLLAAQAHTVSGKRIMKPSDDVPGTNRGLSLRSAINTTDQYTNNIVVTKPLVSATMTAMDDMVSAVKAVRDVAMKAANTEFTKGTREACVAELNDILGQMADIANTKHMDQFVFSGTATDTAPIEEQADGSYSYAGNSGVKTTQVLSWVSLPVNIPGDRVFNFDHSAGADTTDIFTMVKQLADIIQTGEPTDVSAQLDNIDANLDNLLSCSAQIGSWSARMDRARDILSDTSIRLKEMLSDTEDVDLPSAIVELKTQENVYQTALLVTARMLDLSLASLQYSSN